MCNIAGYIGTKQAAPVLIDMMLREEGFDAGYYTGISTIHEGRLYHAKLRGDTKRLCDLTDAVSLPGNIGIIHSRTKSGGGDMWSHPFIAEKQGEPYLAYVANGSTGIFAPYADRFITVGRQLLDEGYKMYSKEPMPNNRYITFDDGTSVHSSDATAQLVLKNLVGGMPLHEAMESALCTILSEDVALAISLGDPDCIGFTKINQPMNVSFVSHGVYMATTAMAFPDDAKEVKPLPMLSSGYVYRDRIVTYPYKTPPCEIVDFDETTGHDIYDTVVNALKTEKYTVGTLRNVLKPFLPEDKSVPLTHTIYEILRSLKNRGLLNMENVTVDGVAEGITAPKFMLWL